MSKHIFILFLFSLVLFNSVPGSAHSSETSYSSSIDLVDDDHGSSASDNHITGHELPPIFICIPFILLLLLIATGPLFFEHFWHKSYPQIAVGLAAIVVIYYIAVMGNTSGPIHALEEYVPFISLLAALYIASGGIGIEIDKKATPIMNVGLLLIGAIVANFIGTTGASMLLVRPFVRLNKTRIQPYHIVFFIFIVSNVGGSLTPIGDPPLFLGFLKGVPFFWTLTHNFLPWLLGIFILTVIFFFIDRNNKTDYSFEDEPVQYTGKVSVVGTRNFLWLLLVILGVFLDPNIEGMEWIPAIHYHGKNISFVKELLWLTIAFLSFKLADKKAHQMNEFNFEPIKEVAFIFIGIFATMTPALELVGSFAKSPAGQELINANSLYWGTGILSGFLDNAPTYVNFLTAALAANGGDIGTLDDVIRFSEGGFPNSVAMLMAISVAAVFFGAMTYIGNGPNFMVKSIAEEIGIKMPSFFGYIIRFSIPFLIPVLLITWLVFFAFA